MLLKKKEYNYEIDPAFREKVKTDEIQFYVELVGKQLDDSIDTGKIITERATNLFNLTAGLLIGLVAYCIQKWEITPEFDDLLTMSIWGCGFLFFVSALLLVAILPKFYCIPGASAKKLFDKALFEDKYTDEVRLKGAYISIIESYQKSIMENNDRNGWRMKLYKFALLLTVIVPLCFAYQFLFVRP